MNRASPSAAASPGAAAKGPMQYRNFRLLSFGQGLGQIGAFFQIVAVSLLVLDRYHSAFALGVALAIQALPMLVLSPWAGVIIDRVHIHRLLRTTAAFGALQALTLGIIVAAGLDSLIVIAGFSLLLGCVQTFDRPSGQAFLPEVVPREAIPSAVAISSSVQGVGRLGGPALAALLYAWLGRQWCFFVNATGWCAVFVALSLFRKSELIARIPQPRAPGQFREGLSFVWNSPIHRAILLSNTAIGCLAFNFPLFYASMVKETLHEGSVWFGVAESMNAITAVGGGIIIARMKIEPARKLYVLACFGLGISLAWSAASPTLWIFLASMLYFGASVVFYQTAAQSLLQRHTPPALIGRVMSLYMLGIIGTTPIGGLIVGWLIEAFSTRVAIGAGAATCFIAAAVVWFYRERAGAASAMEVEAELAPEARQPIPNQR